MRVHLYKYKGSETRVKEDVWRQGGRCQLIVWWTFLHPGLWALEGENYRLRPLPYLMSISWVWGWDHSRSWAVAHTYTGWQPQSHPLLLKFRACKRLIWSQSTVLFLGLRCCSWWFRPTDFDRRPWWERFVASGGSKRNGVQYRENWDTCLSLSKWIHSLASGWQKAVTIHQALKEEARVFFKVA